jgi:hypothetical protein
MTCTIELYIHVRIGSTNVYNNGHNAVLTLGHPIITEVQALSLAYALSRFWDTLKENFVCKVETSTEGISMYQYHTGV